MADEVPGINCANSPLKSMIDVFRLIELVKFFIYSIDPDLSILLSDIKAKLTQDQKDAFELKIKKYNDAIELKREALRIDEEDRKRLAAIQKSALKAEYAQKKYEEESGGLLNSIKKLKVILWGEGSSKFLDKKREQYQKK